MVGMNTNDNKIPNCADWIVAPVLGETNLFMQSFCMIRPATLIPTPVQRMASSLGILARKNIFNSMPSPPNNNVFKSISITPINKESTDMIRSKVPRSNVDKYFLIIRDTPFK